MDTRRRLLDAAAHVFAEFGYARGTTNRIADAAGHSIGSLTSMLVQYLTAPDPVPSLDPVLTGGGAAGLD